MLMRIVMMLFAILLTIGASMQQTKYDEHNKTAPQYSQPAK
ncbi:hypothetical protein [Hydrogenimonas sp. SS33]